MGFLFMALFMILALNSLFEGGPRLWSDEGPAKIFYLKEDREAQQIMGVQFPIEPRLFQKLTPIFSEMKIRALGSSTLLGSLSAQGYL